MIVGAGVLVHAILIVSVISFLHGAIGSSLLVSLQVLNAILFLFVPWIAERLLNLTPIGG